MADAATHGISSLRAVLTSVNFGSAKPSKAALAVLACAGTRTHRRVQPYAAGPLTRSLTIGQCHSAVQCEPLTPEYADGTPKCRQMVLMVQPKKK
jgi:hypothetical protein